MLFLNNFEPFSYKEVILEYWVKKKRGGSNCASKEREATRITGVTSYRSLLVLNNDQGTRKASDYRY